MNKSDIKILIVDDEKDILEALRTHLELLGYRIDIATESQQALEMIKNNPHHIVILDINMPQMDGITLLEKIKTDRPNTIVIMITGYSSVTKVLNSWYSGASDYILKPIKDLSEISATVERAFEVINRWSSIIIKTKELNATAS